MIEYAAVHSSLTHEQIVATLRGFVGSVDGGAELRRSLVGDVDDPSGLARRLAALLLEDGAAELMSTAEMPDPESLENVP